MADLSKIKLGNTVYDLKDATARANMTTLLGEHALAALGAAAWLGVDNSLTDGGEGVVAGGVIKSYIDSQIEAIPTFDVVIDSLGSDGKPATPASADTFHKIYLCPASDPATPNIYIEFLTIRSGTDPNYSYSWEMIGDTAIDLSGYVQKTQTIAGVDLQDNITKAELQAALELKALAYAATATGSTTLETIDSITMSDVTVAGDATVTYTSTAASLTKGDYTPAGSVSVALENAGVLASVATAGTVPSFTEGTFTANTPTTIDVSKFNAGALPTKAADSFTAATFTEGAFDAGSLPSLGAASTGSFATEGLVGEVGTGDDAETLILTAASTSNAVTAQGTFNAGSLPSKAADSFSGGSFTEGAFTQGSLPSLESGFYSEGTAASKAADTFSAGAMPTFNAATVGVQSASFTGTKAENVLVTAVAYDKADATASFSETVTPTVASMAKTAKTIEITVSPDAE